MSEVLWVEDADQLRDLIETEDQVVVDFTAPARCIPCQRFAPHFDKAAETASVSSDMLGRTTFVAVDVDKADWAVVDYGVRGVPTVKLFRNGQFVTDLAKTPQDRTVIKFLAEIRNA